MQTRLGFEKCLLKIVTFPSRSHRWRRRMDPQQSFDPKEERLNKIPHNVIASVGKRRISCILSSDVVRS